MRLRRSGLKRSYVRQSVLSRMANRDKYHEATMTNAGRRPARPTRICKRNGVMTMDRMK